MTLEKCGCKSCGLQADTFIKITAERASFEGTVCAKHASILEEILNPLLVSRRLLRPVSVQALEQQQ